MRDLNAIPTDELFRTLVPGSTLEAMVATWRKEDLGDVGDVTTIAANDDHDTMTVELVARARGVLAGLATVPALVNAYDATMCWEECCADGSAVQPGTVVARFNGAVVSLLAMERPLLNIVCHLSGIASQTRIYVDAVATTNAVVCDTRKTTPGLRGLEKYAVHCGGGTLHRIGLYDAALFKDNHLAMMDEDALADAIAAAAQRARAETPLRFVEVEVDTVQQCQHLLEGAREHIDILLLDNMSDADLRTCVSLRNEHAPSMLLEASGGVTLETVALIAATGVDRISVGALTHSAPSLDFGFDAVKETT